jgi:hypothetical protein
MKMLKITGCTDGHRWYASLQGFLVAFCGDTGSEYQSVEQGGYRNFVQYEDAEVVEVHERFVTESHVSDLGNLVAEHIQKNTQFNVSLSNCDKQALTQALARFLDDVDIHIHKEA